MSVDIEQRIVEMKFNNKGFASGVQDTLNQLDKLDKAVKANGDSAAFQKLQSAADSVKFDKILNGIESINGSLNNMQSFGFQVFDRLSQKAIDLMTNTVKSLSVDQIAGGFKEYELKMDSVRTIMNSSGESIETVNKYLQELNDYSDQTIYSFSDMTSSIGKFTNAGVKLDDAVLAIKGISNEAAVSGANAQQASAAMYNFAQALSSGSVKLIDWKSIENANMATVEFKKALIDTAVELGTVKEAEGGYISTTADANGKVSELFTQTLGFNDSLSSQWLTTDVLVKTLGRYADANDELGQKAYKAAQEVTTFSKMMDALKESVGSGWAQTFEILFGDLEHAKKLWTGINDVVSGFIASVSDTRNGILEMWKAYGGHTYVLQGLKELWSVVKNISHYIGLAFETLFGNRYTQNFDRVKEFFSDRKGFSGNIVVIQRIADLLTNISQKFFDITRKLASAFNPNVLKSRLFLEEIYQCVQAIIIPVRAIVRVVTGLAGKFLPVIFKLIAGGARLIIHLFSRIGYALTEGKLQFALYNLADFIVNGLGGAFDWLLTTIMDIGDKIANVLGFESATEMLMALSDVLGTVFFGAVNLAISAVGLLVTGFTKLKDIIGPILEFIGTSIGNAAEAIKDFWNSNEEFSKIKKSVGGFFDTIFGSFDTNKVNKKTDQVKTRAMELINLGYGVDESWRIAGNSVKKIDGFWSLFDNLTAKATIFLGTISHSKNFRAFVDLLNQLKESIANSQIGQAITKFFDPFTKAYREVFGDAKFLDFFKAFVPVFELFVIQLRNIDTSSVGSTISGVAQALKQLFLNLKGIAEIKFTDLFKKLDLLWEKLFPKTDESAPEGGVFSSIKTLFSNGLNGIFEAIRNFKWSKVGDMIKAFSMVYIIKKIVGIFSDTKKMTGSLKSTLKSFAKVVDNFADASSMVKWQMAADALKVFAESVLKLVAAVVILALIPEDALSKALGALLTIGVIAGVVMLVKHYLIDAKNAAEEGNTASEAIKGIGQLIAENIKEFGQNLINGITSALKKAALAALIISLGIVIALLVGVLERLSNISWPDILSSLGKLFLTSLLLVSILAALEGISQRIGKNKTNYLAMSVILLSIGGALTKMVKVLQILNEVSWDDYKSGMLKMLGVVGILIGTIALLEGINNKLKGNLNKISAGLLIMAFALTTMMVPILVLAAIPEKALLKAVKGLAGIALSIGLLSVAMGGAVRLSGGMKEFAVAILAIVGVAAGIFIFSSALATLIAQSDGIKENAGMLIALAAAFAIFAAVLGGIGYFLGPGLLMVGGAVALFGLGLLFAAEAVKVFAEGVILFAQSMDEIVASVEGREDQVVSAISTIIYAAVKGLMDGLVYALAALLAGLDDALIVLDAKAFSIGEHLTTVVLKIAGGILVGLIKALGEMFGFIGGWIADKVLGTVDYDSSVYEGKAYADASALYGMNQDVVVPTAKEAGKEVTDAYESGFSDTDYTYIDQYGHEVTVKINKSKEEAKAASRHAGYEVKESFGESMNDPGEGTGSRMMGRAAREIQEKTPEVKQAAKEAGDETAKELDVTEEIETNSNSAMEKFKELFPQMQNYVDTEGQLDFTSLMSQFSTSAEDAGGAAETATGDSIQAMLEKYQGMDYESLGLEGQEELTAALEQYGGMPVDASGDITDEMIKEYIDGNYGGAGEYSDEELAEGIETGAPLVRHAASSVSSEGATAIRNQSANWNSTGVGLVQGLANAIIENSGLVEQASANMIHKSVSAMEKAADEHSPSKETYRVGYFMIKGYVNALDENVDMVESAGENTSNAALNSIRNAMSMIPALMDEEMDYSPVISPVLDTSRFNYGLSALTNSINGNRYATIGANLNVGKVDVGSAVGDLSDITNRGNSDLLAALQLQARQNAQLIELLQNQKIYLDGNTLVGKTISRIDNALGQRAILAGRRG